MKKTVKSILKSVGLLKPARSLFKRNLSAEQAHAQKYQHIFTWVLNRKGVEVTYDLKDPYSKRWFLPRYADGNIHEPAATDVFIDYIEKDSVVLDIGGHLGYFSCLAASLASNGSVHVFEVDPKCITLIEQNSAINNFENIIINNMAVSNQNGLETIPVMDNPNPSLVINSSESGIEVQAIRIDDYIEKHGVVPDFIKIDVEGAEWKVLQGMSTLLENAKLTLLVEIHVNNLIDFFDTNYQEIIAFLKVKGFSIKKLNTHREDSSNLLKVEEETKLEGNTMILCTK
ncbi:MAG: FkbM family methyltransferase [Bacteroidota bacterium]